MYSLASTFFSNVKVCGQLIYTPTHYNDGEKIEAKVQILVHKRAKSTLHFTTSHGGKILYKTSDQHSTYDTNKLGTFTLFAYGKTALICCSVLSPGKSIDVTCVPNTENVPLIRNGVKVLDSNNNVVFVNKVSFDITNIIFGEDSQRFIDMQINAGLRPPRWNDICHPDYVIWKKVLKQWNYIKPNRRRKFIGYARQIIPKGPGITFKR
jgi:hypothetical protein